MDVRGGIDTHAVSAMWKINAPGQEVCARVWIVLPAFPTAPRIRGEYQGRNGPEYPPVGMIRSMASGAKNGPHSAGRPRRRRSLRGSHPGSASTVVADALRPVRPPNRTTAGMLPPPRGHSAQTTPHSTRRKVHSIPPHLPRSIPRTSELVRGNSINGSHSHSSKCRRCSW